MALDEEDMGFLQACHFTPFSWCGFPLTPLTPNGFIVSFPLGWKIHVNRSACPFRYREKPLVKRSKRK
jgi:hypothetical protein